MPQSMKHYLMLTGTHFSDSISTLTLCGPNFKKIIWTIISIYVPTKLIPYYLKHRVRLYPKNIRNLLIRKAAIWRQLKSSKSPQLFSKYYKLVNECKLAIFKFDSTQEEKILEANNLGAFYKFVNNKIGNKSSIAPPPLKLSLATYVRLGPSKFIE